MSDLKTQIAEWSVRGSEAVKSGTVAQPWGEFIDDLIAVLAERDRQLAAVRSEAERAMTSSDSADYRRAVANIAAQSINVRAQQLREAEWCPNTGHIVWEELPETIRQYYRELAVKEAAQRKRWTAEELYTLWRGDRPSWPKWDELKEEQQEMWHAFRRKLNAAADPPREPRSPNFFTAGPNGELYEDEEEPLPKTKPNPPRCSESGCDRPATVGPVCGLHPVSGALPPDSPCITNVECLGATTQDRNEIGSHCERCSFSTPEEGARPHRIRHWEVLPLRQPVLPKPRFEARLLDGTMGAWTVMDNGSYCAYFYARPDAESLARRVAAMLNEEGL
jgi:hypothetical protein